MPPGDLASTETSLRAPERERKFVLTSASADAFLERAGAHLQVLVHDRSRPVAFTRTTYLDTEDLVFFRTSDAAVVRRLRIREYAASTSPGRRPVAAGRCFLELKESGAAARTKVRLEAPPAVVTRIVQEGRLHPSAAAYLRFDPRTAVLLDEALAVGPLFAWVATYYRRTSFVADQGHVRVTLDSGISYLRPGPLAALGAPLEPRPVIEHGPERVLELKYTGDPPAWLDEALREAGLVESVRFSKFRSAMIAVCRSRSMAAEAPFHSGGS